MLGEKILVFNYLYYYYFVLTESVSWDSKIDVHKYHRKFKNGWNYCENFK
jgi:hypothetical protein